MEDSAKLLARSEAPTPMRRFGRYARRQLKAAAGAAKQRYFPGRGYMRPNVGRMVKDLSAIKAMVNAEKEIYTAHSVVDQNVDFDTPYTVGITNIAEGTTHGTRDGESVKLHGFRWNVRVKQQTSVTNRLDYRIWLVKYVGPRGSAPAISTFLKVDFDGQFSTSSERNEDWFKSYEVISDSGVRTVISDQVSGQTGYDLWRGYGRFQGDTHQRYSGAAESTLLTDQMYIIMVTSGGDTSTSTGLKLDSQLLISFYDN